MSNSATATTITHEQLTAINYKLTAMSTTRDVDHLIDLYLDSPVIEVKVRTAKRESDVWQERESFFVEPTGYISVGPSVLLLQRVEKEVEGRQPELGEHWTRDGFERKDQPAFGEDKREMPYGV